jgi:hypothetical protein
MAFKSREELEERKKFIQQADQLPPEQQDLWLASNLKKLSVKELESRMEDIEWQYHNRADALGRSYILYKWKLVMHIRGKFDSDRKFGEYLNDLRDRKPEHPICTTKRLVRDIQAAKFCEKHNIKDLNKVKIYPTAIYHLAEPRNSDVANEIYKEIKGKNLPVTEVERLITKAHALEHQSAQAALERMDYDKKEPSEPVEPYKVDVIKGVAQVEEVAAQHKPVIPEFIQAVKEKLFHHEQKEIVHDEELDEFFVPEVKQDDPHRKELLALMVQMDASMLSDDEVIDEIMLFVSQYKRAKLKLIPIFQAAIERSKPTYRGK